MDKKTSAPASWVGDTFSGSASGYTGNLDMRWNRVGSSLTVQTLRYMFTANGNRHSANINFEVKAENGAKWKVDSPDNRRQDGKWHVWDTTHTMAVGGSIWIEIFVTFIFDMGGPDDRRTVSQRFDI
ncbi:hypothetical protein [Pseudomonas sp. EL_65y_Pfl1_R83]|uniref:hypothetical protein n=1 Tax=Pseudomonas sp. EL_65y_Pfl1_R83 TaxID=3088697 RepID=UPI0030DD8A21